MTTHHVARVSLRDQLEEGARRRETKPDLEFASSQGIALVSLWRGGARVPAAIGLRTTVCAQSRHEDDDVLTDHWRITVSPDSVGMRSRLFAERSARSVSTERSRNDPKDAPDAAMFEVRYDMMEALKEAHSELSKLDPPRVGTCVEMTFAITRSLGRVFAFKSSSTEIPRKARDQAIIHNMRAVDLWRALHWPFAGPIKVFGMQIYPFRRFPNPELCELEDVPDSDPWEPDGSLYPLVADIVANRFEQALESLWKATFAQDKHIALQLRAAGYNLDNLEATRMGTSSLSELLRRGRLEGNLTMLGSCDLAELGDDHIAPI